MAKKNSVCDKETNEECFHKKETQYAKKELWILNMKVKGRRKEKGKHLWVKRWKNCDRVCMNICKFIFANALQFIKKKKKKGHLLLKWLILLLNIKGNWNYLLIMKLQ